MKLLRHEAEDGPSVLLFGLGLIGGAMWGLTTVTIRATRLSQLTPEKTLFYQVAVSAVTLPLLSTKVEPKVVLLSNRSDPPVVIVALPALLARK